jgi:hypothetical protein
MSQHLADKELQKLPYMERVRELQGRQKRLRRSSGTT